MYLVADRMGKVTEEDSLQDRLVEKLVWAYGGKSSFAVR